MRFGLLHQYGQFFFVPQQIDDCGQTEATAEVEGFDRGDGLATEQVVADDTPLGVLSCHSRLIVEG